MSTTKDAERYIALKLAQKRIETELIELKASLEEAGSGRYGDYVVSISEQTRETLPLEKVRGTKFWGKIKGLVNKTTFQTVRVERV